MKIAFFCDCNSRGGVWSYTIRTAELLRTMGHKTALITYEPKNSLENELFSSLSQSADEIIIIPGGLSEDAEVKCIYLALKKYKPDAFFPNYRLPPFAAAAKLVNISNVNVVGVCHNDHESSYRVIIRYQTIFSSIICAARKTFDTLSTRLSKSSEEKLLLIPHYVNRTHQVTANYSDSPFRIIYHGRIREEQKHCSEIIEVAAILKRQKAPVIFDLYGDADDASFYKSLISQRDVADTVSIFPSVSWHQLQLELSNCQAAILTSSYEGFCYGAAESVCFGLPVVAYDCGEVIGDYVFSGKNGYIIKWGDRHAMAESIKTLAFDRYLWRQFSDEAIVTGNQSFSSSVAAAGYSKALRPSDSTQVYWPIWRPVFIPEASRSVRRYYDKIGAILGLWD